MCLITIADKSSMYSNLGRSRLGCNLVGLDWVFAQPKPEPSCTFLNSNPNQDDNMKLLSWLATSDFIWLPRDNPNPNQDDNMKLLSWLATSDVIWLPRDRSLGMPLFPRVWASFPPVWPLLRTPVGYLGSQPPWLGKKRLKPE
eukprot:TRINITY_DN18227_c0_g3_i2.p2 TRINITY_DN18227_c0_g3~~TRINITY_DN18227_c0_g3_i2.p2  ORF type:complete len:143 (+),score=6.86 TRINITY_DN18227_c0_g3_i2:522-950(+)